MVFNALREYLKQIYIKSMFSGHIPTERMQSGRERGFEQRWRLFSNALTLHITRTEAFSIFSEIDWDRILTVQLLIMEI